MNEINNESTIEPVVDNNSSDVSERLGETGVIQGVPQWLRDQREEDQKNSRKAGLESQTPVWHRPSSTDTVPQAGRRVTLPGKAVLDDQGNIRRESPDGIVSGIVVKADAVTDEARKRLSS